MIPSPNSLLPIKSLPYWRFARMNKCLLSGVYPGSVVSKAGRPTTNSRSQLIGTIFHSQMEVLHGLIAAGNLSQSNFRDGFNNAIDGIARDIERDAVTRHFGDIRQWPEITDIYLSLRDILRLHRERASVAKVEIHSEEWIYSKDEQLFGRPDAFFISAAGIDLVDYKSGSMLEGDSLKEDYSNQLYFYAYLIEEKYGKYPKSLKLIGRDLGEMSIEPAPKTSVQLADQMRSKLREYNDLVSKPSYMDKITSPSAENCSYCDAKSVCNAFWKNAKQMELPNRAHAVVGTQTLPLERNRHGTTILSLDIQDGSIDCKSLKITRFQPERYPHIEDRVGQTIMVINLKLVSAAVHAIAETIDRTIFLTVEGYS